MKIQKFNLFYPYNRELINYPEKTDLARDLGLLLSKSDDAAKIFYDLVEEKASVEFSGIYLPFVNLNVSVKEAVTMLDDDINIYGIVIAGNKRFYDSIKDTSNTLIDDELLIDMVMTDGNDVFIIDCDPTNHNIKKDNFDKVGSIKAYAEKEGINVEDIKQCTLSWGEFHNNLTKFYDEDIVIKDYITNFNSFKSNMLSVISLDKILQYQDNDVKYIELQKFFRNAVLDYYEILLSSSSLDSLSRMKISKAMDEVYQTNVTRPNTIKVLNSNLTREDLFEDFHLNFDDENLYIDIMFGAHTSQNEFFKEFDISKFMDRDSLNVLDKDFDIVWAPVLKAYGGDYDPVDLITSSHSYTPLQVKDSFDEMLSLNRAQLARSAFISEEDKSNILRIYEALDQEHLIFNKDSILELIEKRLGKDLTNLNPALLMRVRIPLKDIVDLDQSVGELLMVVLTIIL